MLKARSVIKSSMALSFIEFFIFGLQLQLSNDDEIIYYFIQIKAFSAILFMF